MTSWNTTVYRGTRTLACTTRGAGEGECPGSFFISLYSCFNISNSPECGGPGTFDRVKNRYPFLKYDDLMFVTRRIFLAFVWENRVKLSLKSTTFLRLVFQFWISKAGFLVMTCSLEDKKNFTKQLFHVFDILGCFKWIISKKN